MRTSTAYFAGVGTVVVAIAAGIGGGLTLADMMSPSSPRQDVSKLDRQKPSESKASNEPVQAVPYLSAEQSSGAASLQADQSLAEAMTSAWPVDRMASIEPAAKPQQATLTAAAPHEQVAKSEQAKPDVAKSDASTPDEAFAKARQADVKRAERRRAERRQQWADRRHREPRVDPDLRDVEQKVREDSEAREYVAEPATVDAPQIRLFEAD